MTGRLVAIDAPAGDLFVAALRDAWEAGDAVVPLDQRLPQAARVELCRRFGAAEIVDASGERTRLETGTPIEAGDALVVATSGTTGEPKGVVLTHSAVEASAHATSAALDAGAGDAWLCCLPVAHIGGLSVITRSLITGTPLVTHAAFDATACEQAARDGVTLVSLVVTAMRRVDATLFRTILLGGSAIPADRPPNTVATYGMTETGSGVVYERHPLPGVELRIGADGEIFVRSPTLFRGYRNGEPSRIDTDGWFATGDGGAIDAEGVLSVDGRMGDVIVTGGEKVWPVAVERELRRASWVGDVAAIGAPDPEWGEAVVAVIEVAPGATAPHLDAIRDELGERLPRYALPRRVVIVDALPRTALGKIRRARLIDLVDQS